MSAVQENSRYIKRTSESVTQGHPDKVSDMVAAKILDAATEASQAVGKLPRVAMEVSVKGDDEGGAMMLFGEVTLPPGVSLDYVLIARNTVQAIGYDRPEYGFWHGLDKLYVHITQQSADIAQGVGRRRTGAGDQGLMFGGAVADDGPEFMPLPIMVAHALTNRLTELHDTDELGYLRPDGKSQVVVGYEDGRPVAIERVTLAASHDPHVDQDQLREELYQRAVVPILDRFGFSLSDRQNQYICNGTGAFSVCGPLGDAGTTNRKIVVDSYGGYVPHGGGGFNGKDWTKVDVAGAVGARYVAKVLVAGGLADKVQLEVSYTIGQPDPDAMRLDTFGTSHYSDDTISKEARKILDLSPDGIRETLHLAQPIYARVAKGGWFGRAEMPWEQPR